MDDGSCRTKPQRTNRSPNHNQWDEEKRWSNEEYANQERNDEKAADDEDKHACVLSSHRPTISNDATDKSAEQSGDNCTDTGNNPRGFNIHPADANEKGWEPYRKAIDRKANNSHSGKVPPQCRGGT